MTKKNFNKRASEILELEENWDGEGSSSYKKTTVERAKTFLDALLERFLSLYKFDLELPHILPGIDGEIDLEWKSLSFQLLISIPEVETELAGAYGYNYSKDKIKIDFDPLEIKKELIAWLGRQVKNDKGSEE